MSNYRKAVQSSANRMWLEYQLNELFNSGSNPIDRITVVHNDEFIALKNWRYKSESTEPIFLRYYAEGAEPYFLRYRREQKDKVHFFVYVPDSFTVTDDMIRSVIDPVLTSGGIYRIIRTTGYIVYPPPASE